MRTFAPTERLTKLAEKLVESAENPTAVRNSINKSINKIKPSLAKTVPMEFELEQNYPNPFNPITTIKFAIPTEAHVSLRVFTTLGAEVATILNETRTAGTYTETFDASQMASGV
jgi:hypothetical protein